ncbi:MAG: OmpA family protein [Betaproteobacteria bacterium]|nr:OmpA family protein [Betaproteobacteria bacterium]
MKTLRILGTSILALSTMLTAPALAQSTAGYVQSAGATVKNAFGLCWRTGYWTPAMAVMECDPDLVPKPAAPARASAPAVVPPPPPRAAPAPAPAPAPVAAAPKRCDASITLGADEAFEFNKAALKPAAMAKLDKDVVARLPQCAKLELVLVSGYTDRLGSQQYNQKLSEKRADAVKAYLMKKGVDASKIDTMGMGKTLQIKSCPDGKDRKALIACLAPNRRVVVEIKGLAK